MRCEKESSYQSVCDSAAKPDRRISFCTRKKQFPFTLLHQSRICIPFFLPLFCFSSVFIFIISRVCRSLLPPQTSIDVFVERISLLLLLSSSAACSCGAPATATNTNKLFNQNLPNKNSSKQITIDGLIFAFFWQGFRWNFLLETQHSTEIKPIRFIHHEEQRKNEETRETRTKSTKMKKSFLKWNFFSTWNWMVFFSSKKNFLIDFVFNTGITFQIRKFARTHEHTETGNRITFFRFCVLPSKFY